MVIRMQDGFELAPFFPTVKGKLFDRDLPMGTSPRGSLSYSTWRALSGRGRVGKLLIGEALREISLMKLGWFDTWSFP